MPKLNKYLQPPLTVYSVYKVERIRQTRGRPMINSRRGKPTVHPPPAQAPHQRECDTPTLFDSDEELSALPLHLFF